jgi:hypothetical protein
MKQPQIAWIIDGNGKPVWVGMENSYASLNTRAGWSAILQDPLWEESTRRWRAWRAAGYSGTLGEWYSLVWECGTDHQLDCCGHYAWEASCKIEVEDEAGAEILRAMANLCYHERTRRQLARREGERQRLGLAA